MKRVISLVLVALLSAAALSAQTEKRKLEFGEEADLSVRKGAFSFEPLSYLAFGDHLFMMAEGDMNEYHGTNNTEFFMNIVELRVHPYSSGMFSLGLDFDWDYYRLDGDHLWVPDSSKEKVSIVPMAESGIKKIKKSRLSVRTLSVPLAFEQSFGQLTLRVGVEGNYNFPAVSRFKGENQSGGKVKEWKNGERFADTIKTNSFTYGFFGSFSYGGLGAYIKYSPMCQFAEGFGPQFRTISVGVVTGLGM